MRPPALAALVCLALASVAVAGPRPCGNDVDGRGTVVPCRCGDVLVSNRTLGDEDPVTQEPCPGTGLIVQVSGDGGSVLDLAGHTLQGTGHGVGVEVLAGGSAGLTLEGPGAVRGFATGVHSPRGGLAAARDVLVADNARNGFDVIGIGYAITGCEAVRNGRTGFALRGRDYHAEGNRALENGRAGIDASGRDAVIGGAGANEATANGADGVHVRGRGHAVSDFTVTGNGRRGLRAHVAHGRIARTVASANHREGVHADGPSLAVDTNVAEDNGRASRCHQKRGCR